MPPRLAWWGVGPNIFARPRVVWLRWGVVCGGVFTYDVGGMRGVLVVCVSERHGGYTVGDIYL